VDILQMTAITQMTVSSLSKSSYVNGIFELSHNT